MRISMLFIKYGLDCSPGIAGRTMLLATGINGKGGGSFVGASHVWLVGGDSKVYTPKKQG